MPIWVLVFEDFQHMLISFLLRARVFFKHYTHGDEASYLFTIYEMKGLASI
jgi:hypothetical protein